MGALDQHELRGVPARARQMLLDYAQQKRELTKAPRLSLDATETDRRAAAQEMQYDLTMLKKQTQADLEALARDSATKSAALVLGVKQSLRPSAGSPEADLARETAESRAWLRMERHLTRDASKVDGSVHSSVAAANNLASVNARLNEMMQTALAEGDEASVQALLAEAQSFVAFHFDSDMGAAARADLLGVVSAARPEFAATLATLQEAEAGTQAVTAALSSAARGLAEDRSLISIPGWPGDEPHEDVLLAEDGDKVQVSSWGGAVRTLRIEPTAAPVESAENAA